MTHFWSCINRSYLKETVSKQNLRFSKGLPPQGQTGKAVQVGRCKTWIPVFINSFETFWIFKIFRSVGVRLWCLTADILGGSERWTELFEGQSSQQRLMVLLQTLADKTSKEFFEGRVRLPSFYNTKLPTYLCKYSHIWKTTTNQNTQTKFLPICHQGHWKWCTHFPSLRGSVEECWTEESWCCENH